MVKAIDKMETWSVGEIMQTEEEEAEEADVIRYEIYHYPADYTLTTYVDRWNNKQLRIPEFQRDFVWGKVQASKLIESFLLGLPVPPVFLYKQRKTNKLLVLDGQQRIFSVIRYFRNEFDGGDFRLTGVSSKWEGKAFTELDEPDRNQLMDSVLRAIVVQQVDPKDDTSVFQIFERLNTGGVNLNAMEVRKCVYAGKFYDLLDKLNRIQAWRKLIGKPALDKRLRDVEFILRICAFNDKLDKYEKPMKEFLSQHMIEINRLSQKKREEYLKECEEMFTRGCKYLLENVGEKPFHIRKRLNYAVMDSTMYCVFRAVDRDVQGFKDKFESLLRSKGYVRSVTYNTSDEKTVQTRFRTAKRYLLTKRIDRK